MHRLGLHKSFHLYLKILPKSLNLSIRNSQSSFIFCLSLTHSRITPIVSRRSVTTEAAAIKAHHRPPPSATHECGSATSYPLFNLIIPRFSLSSAKHALMCKIPRFSVSSNTHQCANATSCLLFNVIIPKAPHFILACFVEYNYLEEVVVTCYLSHHSMLLVP